MHRSNAIQQHLAQLHQLLASQSSEYASLTVKEATDKYLAERPLKEHTKKMYTMCFEATFGRLSAADISAVKLVEVTREQIMAGFRSASGKQVANLAICLLRGTFNHLELTPPLRRFPRNQMRPRDRVIPRELLPRLWQAVAKMNPMTTLALVFLLGFGLRRSEVANLMWTDFTATQFTVRATKNGKDLTLPITPKLRVALPESRGLLVCPKSLKKHAVHKLRNELEFAWSAHDCRRTFATTAVELGISSYLIKALLNHATGDITFEHYVRPSMAAKLQALETIQQVLLP